LSFQAVKQILQLNGLDAIWERAAYSETRMGIEPISPRYYPRTFSYRYTRYQSVP
jgi:hypothetical protein